MKFAVRARKAPYTMDAETGGNDAGKVQRVICGKENERLRAGLVNPAL
jgi:hypothetical protein